MGNVAKKFLGPWFVILSFVYYGLCFIAMLTGLETWLGWPGWVAFIVGVFVIGGFPLISAFLGIMGAIKGWGWEWYWAVIVFMPGILLFALSMGSGLVGLVASLFSKNRSDHQTQMKKELKTPQMKGDAIEQFKTGVKYLDGKGVPQDHAQAVKYFCLAAEQQYAPAQVNLGYAYYEGNGVSKNYEEAVKWFLLAAEQGLDFSQYMLAKCYLAGHGVEKDLVEAIKWLDLASAQGYSRAHYLLGLLLSAGKNNEPANAPKAYAFLTLAEKEKIDDAVRAKEILLEKMTPQQIDEGKRLSIEYANEFMGETPDITRD